MMRAVRDHHRRWPPRLTKIRPGPPPRPAPPVSRQRSDLQSFSQVRAYDNGVQCRVARYPPPVVDWQGPGRIGPGPRDDREASPWGQGTITDTHTAYRPARLP